MRGKKIENIFLVIHETTFIFGEQKKGKIG